MRPTALTLAGFALLAAGCARPAAYWHNRWLDFTQCFTLQAGYGLGLDVELHVTDWVATGVGASLGVKYGCIGGHPVGEDTEHAGPDLHLGFPIRQLAYLSVPEPDIQGWPPGLHPLLMTDIASRQAGFACPFVTPSGSTPPSYLLSGQRVTASVLFLNLVAFSESGGRRYDAKAADRFEMDIAATLLVPSFRVGFNPAEFLDFLLGWTTLDIAGDDQAVQTLDNGPPTREDELTGERRICTPASGGTT
ncbi:MAG: hypothetical protein FJ290_27155 [Planctomycetes bacterium]|nr:hypothetical protein [Planctomycetota bacterium]